MISTARDAAVVPDFPTFGTAEPTAPVTRADFERALRFLNMSDLELRELVLSLAAQVVTLTEELTRRLDQTQPALEATVAENTPATLKQIRAADAKHVGRVWLETELEDKYAVTGPDVPCMELLDICKARCCKLLFPLSSRDLDEGIIRWDYGRPYMIRQRASDGYCVHNAPDSHGCSVHAQRPLVCRQYDCRQDKRIWIDFEKRIPAPLDVHIDEEKPFDLMERAARYAHAMLVERTAVGEVYPEETPREGPPPTPGTRLFPWRKP
jgi:hypothetical protein